jgi:hypothetical protein
MPRIVAPTALLCLLLAAAFPAAGVAVAAEADGLDVGTAALEIGDRLEAWRHFDSVERASFENPSRRAAALAGVGIAAFGLGEYAEAADACRAASEGWVHIADTGKPGTAQSRPYSLGSRGRTPSPATRASSQTRPWRPTTCAPRHCSSTRP